MIRLVVSLRIDAADEPSLVTYFNDIYAPMLTKQPGFVSASLARLYSDDALDEIDAEHPRYNYHLNLEFESEALRRRWVSRPEHDAAWARFVGFAEEAVHAGYDVVAARPQAKPSGGSPG